MKYIDSLCGKVLCVALAVVGLLTVSCSRSSVASHSNGLSSLPQQLPVWIDCSQIDPGKNDGILNVHVQSPLGSQGDVRREWAEIESTLQDNLGSVYAGGTSTDGRVWAIAGRAKKGAVAPGYYDVFTRVLVIRWESSRPQLFVFDVPSDLDMGYLLDVTSDRVVLGNARSEWFVATIPALIQRTSGSAENISGTVVPADAPVGRNARTVRLVHPAGWVVRSYWPDGVNMTTSIVSTSTKESIAIGSSNGVAHISPRCIAIDSGGVVARWREARGWLVEDLAEKYSLSPRAVSVSGDAKLMWISNARSAGPSLWPAPTNLLITESDEVRKLGDADIFAPSRICVWIDRSVIK